MTIVRRIGRVLGILVALGVSILVTVAIFPNHFRLMFDSVTVDGTIATTPVGRSCESAACARADVRYTTESGATFVKNLEVKFGSRLGDVIEVRYLDDAPHVATADPLSGRMFGFFIFALLGPALLLSLVVTGAIGGWRRLRAVGEIP